MKKATQIQKEKKKRANEEPSATRRNFMPIALLRFAQYFAGNFDFDSSRSGSACIRAIGDSSKLK